MKRHRSKKAIVYAAINIVNGKRYIGVTSGTLKRRSVEHFSAAKRFAHNGAFYRALRKYGKSAFEWVILKQCDSYVDAAAAEIELISILTPEYNSTKGGDGRLGGGLSEEGRRRISEANIGKQRRLGAKHTEETKATLKAIGLENRDKWFQYSHLGPASLSKRVICITDNLTFDSASAAARHYGVAKSAVIELCCGKRNRKTVGGHVFRYLDPVQ